MKNKAICVIISLIVIVLCMVGVYFALNYSYNEKQIEQEQLVLEYKNEISSLYAELDNKDSVIKSLEDELEVIRLNETNTEAVEIEVEQESKEIPRYEFPAEKKLGPLSEYESPVVILDYEAQRYGYENAALNLIYSTENISYESNDYRIVVLASMFDRTSGFVVDYVVRRNDVSEEKVISFDDPDSINDDDWKQFVPENRVVRLNEGEFVKYNN